MKRKNEELSFVGMHTADNPLSLTLPARLQLLGEARLYIGRRVVSRFPAGKSLQLLTYLALRPGVFHTRAQLVELLWPHVPEETGRARLSVALTFLRGLLEASQEPGSVVNADRTSLCLLPHRIQTDVADFEHALNGAAREFARPEPNKPGALSLLGDALRVYAGEFLPGVEDDWVERERARLAVRHEQAQNAWTTHTRRRPPRPRSASPIAAPPSTLPVLQLRPDTGAKAVLPPRLTRFFGREQEIARLRERDGYSRLVTLTGPGGVGKTRLCLEAASAEADQPVVWVPLADVSDTSAVLPAIAQALHLPTQSGDVLEAVLYALNAVPALVLLDNAEHLREAVASVVASLLAGTLSAFWVTSREPLGIEGERLVLVGPLSLPSDGEAEAQIVAQSRAGALFTDRAQAARPDFHLTDRNAAQVARLCRRLDGVPLALEIAAARLQTASLGQILDTLHAGGGHKMAHSARRNAPDRHRSLESAIAWSVRLLVPETAQFFFALSVFVGGWTSEAAEVVTGDSLASDRLAELVQASLVVTEETYGETLRYHMLETVRDYAAAQLDDVTRTVLEDRHAACFTRLADEAAETIYGWAPSPLADRLVSDTSNLLHALNTLKNRDASGMLYLRGAGAIGRLLYRDYDNIVPHLEAALARAPLEDSRERANALFALYWCRVVVGSGETTFEALHKAIAISRRLGDDRHLIRLLSLDVNDLPALEEAIARAQQQNLVWPQAWAECQRAMHLFRGGEAAYAETQFAHADALAQSAGVANHPGLRTEWSFCLLWRGKARQARSLLEDAVSVLDAAGWRHEADHPRWVLATACTTLGDYEAACRHAQIIAEHRRALSPSFYTSEPWRALASAHLGRGDIKQAQNAADEAARQLRAANPDFGPAYVGAIYAEIALARNQNEEAYAAVGEAYDILHRQFGISALSEAPFWIGITPVNTRSVLARAELRLGLWEAASTGLRDTLRFRHRLELYQGAFHEIEGLACLAAESGDTTRAARLFAASATLRLRAGTPPLPHQSDYITRYTARLQANAALAPAWRDGQNLSLPQAAELALRTCYELWACKYDSSKPFALALTSIKPANTTK